MQFDCNCLGKSLWNKVAKAALSKSKSQELSGFSKASGHSGETGGCFVTLQLLTVSSAKLKLY